MKDDEKEEKEEKEKKAKDAPQESGDPPQGPPDDDPD